MAARIPTWTIEGSDRLRNLYARIGLPFRACEQPFLCWVTFNRRNLTIFNSPPLLLISTQDEKLRDHASNELITIGPMYGLEDVTYPCFVYKRGYQRPVRIITHSLIDQFQPQFQPRSLPLMRPMSSEPF